MNQVNPVLPEESLKNSKIILLLQDKSTWIDNYRDLPQTGYLLTFLARIGILRHHSYKQKAKNSEIMNSFAFFKFCHGKLCKIKDTYASGISK